MKLVENFLKSFIFAYYLPASLFIITNYFILAVSLNQGELSGARQFIDSLVFIDPLLLYVILSGFLSYGLSSGNYQIIRLFEGYKFKRIFHPFKVIRRNKKESLFQQQIKLEKENKAKYDKEKTEELLQVKYKLEVEYPQNSSHVLPTEIGNIFRAFEEYPVRKYGIQTIAMWPKLLLALPEGDQKHLEEAQSSMMFYLSSCLLTTIVFAESLIVGTWLYQGGGNLSVIQNVALISGILSLFFHRMSIDSVKGFGEVVKATFDLRRKDLLKALGYPIDETLHNERRKWEWISNFHLYKDWGSIVDESDNKESVKEAEQNQLNSVA